MDTEKLLQALTPEETQEFAAVLADVFEVEALRRGIELPLAAGSVAVEAATTEPAVEVIPHTKESIAEQLGIAFTAYRAVARELLSEENYRLPLASVETIAEEFNGWFTDEKLAALTAAQEANPEAHFTLVATPNIVVDAKAIARVAIIFGENQASSTYVYRSLNKKYTNEQLSGTNPENDKAVVFSLIPSACTPGLTGTVEEQKALLANLQLKNSSLKVPSVLDAVTYWQTLRAQGDRLADGNNFDRTYICHFDLPEKRILGISRVTRSCVFDNGQPRLDYSGPQYMHRGRASLG